MVIMELGDIWEGINYTTGSVLYLICPDNKANNSTFQ